MRRVRNGLASLLPIFWVLSSGAANPSDEETRAPTDLESLMEIFAASGGVRARFQESRHISILTDPIETGGMLYFAPPDRLARHATRPGRSSVVVEAGRVSFADETGTRSFDLSTSEVAQTLVGNLIINPQLVNYGTVKRFHARLGQIAHVNDQSLVENDQRRSAPAKVEQARDV